MTSTKTTTKTTAANATANAKEARDIELGRKYCCVVCNDEKWKDKNGKPTEQRLKICVRCKSASYCCAEHQRADWKKEGVGSHRNWCYDYSPKTTKKWWKTKQIDCSACCRRHPVTHGAGYCAGAPYGVPGEVHFGDLELIIWEVGDVVLSAFDRSAKGITYWGGAETKKQGRNLRKIFEKKYKGDEEKFFVDYPQCFRWTCCGNGGAQTYGGCDHHSAEGPKPCNCDFCTRGMAIPESMRYKTKNNWGLQRKWGPDPRSYNASRGDTAHLMRTMMGI